MKQNYDYHNELEILVLFSPQTYSRSPAGPLTSSPSPVSVARSNFYYKRPLTLIFTSMDRLSFRYLRKTIFRSNFVKLQTLLLILFCWSF